MQLLVFAYLLHKGWAKKHLVIVPNISLVIQTSEGFEEYAENTPLEGNMLIQMMGGGKSKTKKDVDVVIGTYQTLRNLPEEFFDDINCVCVDEAHHTQAKSIKDFITRVNAHFVNKRAFEGLIMAGAFDEIEINRALLFNNVDLLLMESNRIRRKNIEGQIDIFSEHEEENQEIRLPNTKEWSEIEKLKGEFEFLGAYLSGHPMEKYSNDMINHKVSTYTEFIHNIKTKKYKQARLAGVIQNRVNRRGKTGRMYSFIKLSDISQEFETMFFSDMIDKYNDLIFTGNVIIIKVDADIQADAVRLRVTEVIQANINEKFLMNGSHEISSQSTDEPFEVDKPEVNLIKNEYSDEYTIKLANIDILDDIAKRLKSGRGTDIVNLIFYDTNLKKDIKLGIGDSFNFDSELKTYLQSLPGVELFNKQP